MLLITGVTDAALQNKSLILPNGTTLSIQIYFRPNQYGWFLNYVINGTFVVRGIRITSNANILRPWKDLLTFGLACFTVDNREPTQQQDFLSGASKLYVLSASEVTDYEKFLAGR